MQSNTAYLLMIFDEYKVSVSINIHRIIFHHGIAPSYALQREYLYTAISYFTPCVPISYQTRLELQALTNTN